MTASAASPDKLDFGRALPVFILTFVDVLGLTVILPLLHLYAVAFGASPLQIGLVVAAFPIAQLIGVPVMGALSDQFGRKPLLLISQISTCASFIMLGLANSLALVVLSRVVDGVFGANLATAQAALSDISTEKTRAQALGLVGAAFGLGFIFGPIISAISLEFTDSLFVPAFIAAIYSFCSILLTVFVFEETLPPEKRKRRAAGSERAQPFSGLRLMGQGQISWLLALIFAQQFIFFGFESTLGLFTLSRLGMLGQGNAILFLLVGVVLAVVQVRYIGRWSHKYGERRLVFAALALLAVGLTLLALTPERPQPFYVQRITENRLLEQNSSSTEAILGQINVSLPDEARRGIGGVLWLGIAIVPLAVGAGMIRPALNSLMTLQVDKAEYGGVLGLSAAVVSAANAGAPLVAAIIFQYYGSTAPFLIGGVVMGLLWVMSIFVLRGFDEHKQADG